MKLSSITFERTEWNISSINKTKAIIVSLHIQQIEMHDLEQFREMKLRVVGN